ncbi:MAG: SDR family NAD(P)-dependent oxidoreductase [Patescibacteria group bacterium]
MSNRLESDARSEFKEGQPLKGRRILVTGGATGAGLATSIALADAGADLIIGTRHFSHFEDAASKMDGVSPTPFVADLTDSDSTRKALSFLEDASKLPTDIVLSAAGGMEDFSTKLALELGRAARAKTPEDKKEMLGVLSGHVKEWVSGAQDKAIAINFLANVNLVQSAAVNVESRLRVVYYSSIPSTFFESQDAPDFYRGVASSKNQFEQWMHRSGMAYPNVDMTIVSGGLIEDSLVGKMVTRFLVPMLPVEQQEEIAKGYIHNSDMVEATKQVLTSDTTDLGTSPKVVYVVGRGKIVDNVEPSDPVFAFNGLDFASLSASVAA